MNWKTMLAYVTGSVDEELLRRNEYLVAENRILRNHVVGRPKLSDGELPPSDRSYLQDQLGVLAARCQWVQDEQQRSFLEDRINALLGQVGGQP